MHIYFDKVRTRAAFMLGLNDQELLLGYQKDAY